MSRGFSRKFFSNYRQTVNDIVFCNRGADFMVTVYYENGQVVKMIPEPSESYYNVRELINEATSIVSDGVPYDLTNKKSIFSIAIPKYTNCHSNKHAQSLGATGYLDYVLRMHAGLLWGKQTDLSTACLMKATQLMKYSTLGWQKKDFYRIVDWLVQLGRFEKAKEWEDWIERNIPTFEDEMLEKFKNVVKSANYLGTDLVYTSWAGGQSAVRAKYQGRVYSLAGNDKRFPMLPNFMRRAQSICPIGGAFTFWDDKELDTIYYKGEDIHVLKASWRPFVDDRTDQDRKMYMELQNEIKRQQESAIAKKVYYRLQTVIPDILPKSFGVFSQMKNQNSEKYKELVERAEAAGFVFPPMVVEIEEPVDPDPNYNGG